jgi:hypothetical protein
LLGNWDLKKWRDPASTKGARECSPRQKGSHARWKHPDGRATTIPIHGKAEIGSWLFQEILKQMRITEEEFNQLR